MDSKSNMYPHVHDAPPQYGDYNAPAMIPAETAPQPSVITVQQPNVYVQPPIQNNNLGRMPVTVTCPSCHTRQRTNVNHEPSTKTHLLALLICLVGGICCCCIPYCVDSCQSATHTCPACGAFVGTYQN
ncbi:lipopolysaccharide-induced tumor necrosis factor-alpha factor homolog isoform X1 [Drosophila innubila]|uniref:lipopolysaccharide-induced tumor necrosis factor-alpha factor homolog isoform X1 n=1 Tax=Drosophila innubila TaxID=198719 RepID=UPI00148C2EB3|nr:lipopolysaccharide-induced tumor necrosis factor-alpha factor homolog isoform X1 [Drosophila innubila]